MSYRYGSQPVPGAHHYGGGGLGVLGSSVPSTGTNGPGYLYNDLSLPADAGKEVRGLVITPPSAGTFFAYEDSSFTFTAPNGSYSFVYRLYVDGADMGTATGTINVGGAVAHAATGALTAQSASGSGVAARAAGGAPVTHTASGALTAQNASIAAATAHSVKHTASGALSAQSASIQGGNTVPSYMPSPRVCSSPARVSSYSSPARVSSYSSAVRQ